MQFSKQNTHQKNASFDGQILLVYRVCIITIFYFGKHDVMKEIFSIQLSALYLENADPIYKST
jgi:hypothetical protein